MSTTPIPAARLNLMRTGAVTALGTVAALLGTCTTAHQSSEPVVATLVVMGSLIASTMWLLCADAPGEGVPMSVFTIAWGMLCVALGVAEGVWMQWPDAAARMSVVGICAMVGASVQTWQWSRARVR